MLLVEEAGPHNRFIGVSGQDVESIGCQRLAAAEQVPSSALCRRPVEVGRLILEMEDEPQLDAGVRDCELDPVAPRQVNCLLEVRVIIDIEDAPDLVVRPPPRTASLQSVSALSSYRLLDELERAAMITSDRDQGSLSAPLRPVGDIPLLGSFSFDEDQEFPSDGVSGNAPPRWTTGSPWAQERLPDVISSVTAANSWRERIGVAPYLPAR